MQTKYPSRGACAGSRVAPWLLALLLGVGPRQGAAGEKPAVLRAAEAARSSSTLITARIEYSHWRRPIGQDQPDHTLFYTFQCAGDQYLTRFWGDEEGVVMRDPRGQPAGEEYSFCGPRHMLRTEDGVWIHAENDPSAQVWSPGDHQPYQSQMFDLRRLSLNPTSHHADLEEVCRAAGLSSPEYSVSTEDKLDVVTATVGERAIRWWIDRARNFSIVRAQTLRHGRPTLECLYTVEQIDNVWTTTRVERLVPGTGSARGEPIEILQVHHAEFNRPEHPQQLTPEHIGVETGTYVEFQSDASREGYWDGGKIIPVDEFFAKLRSGELVRGEGVTRALASLPRVTPQMLAAQRAADEGADSTRSGAEALSHPLPASAAEMRRQLESEWARHTRRFIIQYGLDREQTQRAWTVLKDCQEMAGRYLNREREAFEKLEKHRPSTGSSPPAPASSPVIDERWRALRRPIDRIFETELKPRLERLPTRAQRQRAERPTGHD